MTENFLNQKKNAYLESLGEIINDKILITEKTSLQSSEIKQNCWAISLPNDQTPYPQVDDFVSFIQNVIKDRSQQLDESGIDVDLKFYLWNDKQAMQLRFNIINNNHLELPFKGKIQFTPLAEIIEEFLKTKNHEVIPWADTINKNKTFDFEPAGDSVTKVYSIIIKKNRPHHN